MRSAGQRYVHDVVLMRIHSHRLSDALGRELKVDQLPAHRIKSDDPSQTVRFTLSLCPTLHKLPNVRFARYSDCLSNSRSGSLELSKISAYLMCQCPSRSRPSKSVGIIFEKVAGEEFGKEAGIRPQIIRRVFV